MAEQKLISLGQCCSLVEQDFIRSCPTSKRLHQYCILSVSVEIMFVVHCG